jgi:hypothetical protein
MSRLEVVGGRAMHDARNKRGTRSREREERTLDSESLLGAGMDAAYLVNNNTPHPPMFLISVDSKRVTGVLCLQESKWIGSLGFARGKSVDSEGVRRTASRGRMVRRAQRNRANLTKLL